MTLRLKILIGILIGLTLAHGLLLITKIKNDILTNKEIMTMETQSRFKILEDEIGNLNKQITNLPEKIKYEKTKLEYKLQQATVIIYNKTNSAVGSGVTIKYKGQFYILSAGHMVESLEDVLAFGENGQEIGEVEIIKWDFTMVEENIDGNSDFTKATDLILLRPKNKNLIPRVYIELADFEPQSPTEVYIVGNPAGIEDVVSEGRVIRYMNNFMYITDNIYYGSSGGGVFNLSGKLIGIVSHMYPISSNPLVLPYMTYGIVRLNIIKQFLGDIK